VCQCVCGVSSDIIVINRLDSNILRQLIWWLTYAVDDTDMNVFSIKIGICYIQ
jgi:hypothetical protein